MARLLTILGVVCALAVVITWAALGADRGWSKTLIPIEKTDPVTELAYTEYEHRFVPGLDFLVAGLATSVVLFTCGFAISRFRHHSKKP